MTSLARPLLLAVALAALLAATGCESAPTRHARSTQTFTYRAGAAPASVDMEIVTELTVVLPGPEPGSGLAWAIVSNNNKVIDQTASLRVVTSPWGAPVTTTTFYALKPGKSLLQFFLLPVSQREAFPVQKCEINVRVRD